MTTATLTRAAARPAAEGTTASAPSPGWSG